MFIRKIRVQRISRIARLLQSNFIGDLALPLLASDTSGTPTIHHFPTTPGAFDATFNGSSTYEDTFATKLPAPAFNFAVSGQVTGDGKPVSDVTVSDNAGHAATTDSEGYYTLAGLTAGVYTVTLTRNGDAAPVAVRVISVPPDATNQNFALFYSPKNVFLPIVVNSP